MSVSVEIFFTRGGGYSRSVGIADTLYSDWRLQGQNIGRQKEFLRTKGAQDRTKGALSIQSAGNRVCMLSSFFFPWELSGGRPECAALGVCEVTG